MRNGRRQHGRANKRWKHAPVLTPQVVLDLRERVMYGDLQGKSLKSIGAMQNPHVGPGEIARALGGFGPYANYPTTNVITDKTFLSSSRPGVLMPARARFIKENPEVEKEIIRQANVDIDELVEAPETTETPEQNDIVPKRETRGVKGKGGVHLDISDDEVADIRTDFQLGSRIEELMEKYHTSWSTTYRIVHGMGRWKNLPRLKRGVIYQHPTNKKEPLIVEPDRTPMTTIPTVEVITEPEPIDIAPSPMEDSVLSMVGKMVEMVGADKLGYMRSPTGRSLDHILSDLAAAQELMTNTINELREWAAQVYADARSQ